MTKKVVLTLLALILAAVPALADEVQSEAEVRNMPPEILHVNFVTPDDDEARSGMQVIPTPGETRVVDVEVKVRDDNGHPDVSRVNVTFLGRDNATKIEGPRPATFDSGRGRTSTYTVSLDVPYWLPPGSYTIAASADDKPGARHSGYATLEVTETLAMGVSEATVGFGAFQPGDRTPPAAVEVRNLGNLPLDVEIAGTDLVAPEATIPVDRVKASLSESMDPMVALGVAPTLLGSFNLASGDSSARPVWFSLHAPTGDEQYVPQATYRGAITVSAVVDS